MEHTVEKRDDVWIVHFTGELMVDSIAAMRAVLLEALGSAESSLSLDLKEVRSADLPCLQLLCSAHRTAIRLQKKLSVAQPYPEPLTQAIRDSGFLRHIGCSCGTDGSCLWIPEH